MVFELRKKKILIISPQPFEGLLVSKQHYAIELAKKGNLIYFLEPPLMDGNSFVSKEELTEYPGITLIKYKAFFNLNVRFHVRFLFDLLMHFQVKKLLNSINDEIDIVWSFDTNLYASLSWFGAKIKIYHVVDPVKFKYQRALGNTAHLIIGVSEKILRSFSEVKVPKYFINHGITGAYFQLAKNLLEAGIPYEPEKTIRVGYIGNLLRGPFNYPVFQEIITNHPTHHFHFWGNDQVKNDSSVESISFMKFLKAQGNVFLHGLKKPEELVEDLRCMDAFLLAYLFIEGESDQSNSHKILEYLSTGKVVISSFVETYKGMEPLICMTAENKDNELPSLFDKIIDQLAWVNSHLHQEKRIKLALENNYSNHINKIENLITNL